MGYIIASTDRSYTPMEVRLSRDLLRFKRNRRLEEMEMELIRVEHNPSCKVKKKHRSK
jgi:hypothetical protein